ncbi:MAG: hypothetical protein ACYDBB_07395 [Armatimonadota bacterium]
MLESLFDKIKREGYQPDDEQAGTPPANEAEIRAAPTASGLQAQVDKLTLVNMALWSLLKEKAGLTNEQLRRRIEQIDLADGQLDGRVRTEAKICPQCRRVISARHHRCLYCDFTPTNEEGFDIFQAGPTSTATCERADSWGQPGSPEDPPCGT